MTPAQAAWLRKLKDEGPQPFAWHLPAARCANEGWTVTDKPMGGGNESITPAGLAALEAHEKTLPTDQG